jgi:hypothetical protein
MKKLLTISAVLVLGACAPGSLWTNSGSNGKSEYAYVGCHKVVQNPAKNGEVAFGPFGVGTWTSGDHVFFKQVSKDGTVGKVATGKPCD